MHSGILNEKQEPETKNKVTGGKTMLEGNEKNGFFAGSDELDLGNDTSGFDDFAIFDEDIGGVFGNTDTTSGPAETVAQKQPEEPKVQSDTEKDSVSPIKNTTAEKVEETKNEETASIQPTAEVSAKPENAVSSGAEVPNLFDAAIAQAEEKEAKATASSLIEKLPIFSYGSAKEEIVDTSKTFDQLRNEKSEDFPELDDSTSVTWKMVYGTITKTVSTPKKTTVAGMKSQIEKSKEFLDSLKKAKGEIECKVTPSVTAKKKGTASPYKGVCASIEEAAACGKIISFIPSDDGKVYEVRMNRIGTFVAEAGNVSALKKVRAGFIPALPKIPYEILSEIIAFFKANITETSELEAMAIIYWSVPESKCHIYIPKQAVSKTSVDSSLPDMNEEEFVLVMEVHSHNTMPTVFSPTDDEDEKVTRLYTVIGRMNKVFPDITTRISVGGKYVAIDPAQVFEGINGSYPEKWNLAVEAKQYPAKEGFA